MLRNLVRFHNCLGHAFSPPTVCPRGQMFKLLPLLSVNSESYSIVTERKKFYEDVSISHGEGGMFEINLDRRKLKTPGGKLFTAPNQALAIAVANEWDTQKDMLKFYSMHMNTLCNTALDNPTFRSKDQMITAALKYLETDTVWYNVVIGSSTSILGPEIPQATMDTFRQHLGSYNFWSLTGLEYVITQLKSVVLAFALIDKHITVEQAVLLSRLEEEFQIGHWGNVEWAHDVDLYELRSRTAAGALFVHFSSESSAVKRKLMQD
ncbi:ATP synthase mitochondrial F1 complex assembly factor 2 isoform X2 [Salmo salar]|uniref:ATP synthase mitochondrial F1 complex assembly factor 2 isoform X2 n=1 Tax=Salmo salar TaxID=8030 RepID=A0A1S3Q5D1_SALSA|nr:ATP synthase mitochondrial F1 complex assembly factor 2 isoform X2 [Salmo salar]|eukprot:XP_014035180.1 PREDICTED: ATP synthase mitochondrial F1 complex assembly factor 2-like isoform X3 [Salmo salar]